MITGYGMAMERAAVNYDCDQDDLPVLNAVIESGNESIIQSSRLGREVLRELEALRHIVPVVTEHNPFPHAAGNTAPGSYPDMVQAAAAQEDADEIQGKNIETPADKNPDVTLVENQLDLDLLEAGGNPLQPPDDMHFVIRNLPEAEEDDIELMIDELVDRHITDLRKDIRRLLERARQTA
jgi:hypothetical protein